MRLFLLAQDIGELEIGLEEEGKLAKITRVKAAPEQHLFEIDKQLKDWNCSLESIKGVYVVTGPGSFTASRVSITIANAIAFSQGIPVFPIQNDQRHSLADLHDAVNHSEGQSFAIPHYDRDPHITKPKS